MVMRSVLVLYNVVYFNTLAANWEETQKNFPKGLSHRKAD